MPEPRLEADGIALRPFEIKDGAAMVAACKDPDILRFTFMQDGLTEDGAVEWINRSNERWRNEYPRFAIVETDDDRLLGQVGLNVNIRHVSAEGHYWVTASERRRRVASSALSGIGCGLGLLQGYPAFVPGDPPGERGLQQTGGQDGAHPRGCVEVL